jgi:hypothetical protein
MVTRRQTYVVALTPLVIVLVTVVEAGVEVELVAIVLPAEFVVVITITVAPSVEEGIVEVELVVIVLPAEFVVMMTTTVEPFGRSALMFDSREAI